METPTPTSLRFRFGGFELNPRTGELVSEVGKAQLQDQPLQLLLALLERPGELVTREELRGKLWSAGTFVDFDRGLNKAVNKLREVLKDSADQPQFIETLPRKGYRFIGTVTRYSPPEEPPKTEVPVPARAHWRWRYAVGIGIIAAVLGILLGNMRMWRDAIASRLTPSHPQITSLAVLPLENLSGDPEQAYFADGMTDALITEVARAGTMRVISRTTVLRYKGTRKPIQQIGRELNVDAVVEGTVLRSGGRVRITAQLIQVSTDNHLWAQSYEREATEILRLQQEVATEIARRVGSVVNPVEPLRTVNPEAYGEYLQGRFYFYQYTADGWQKAIEHYNRAINADPSFAPAYSGLAESYIVAWAWNTFPSTDALRTGKAAAQKALALDPTLASAHLALGEAYDQEWEHERADQELRRALELNPNDPLAWQLHGAHWLYKGEFRIGIAEQERARTLDPFSPIINANLARAYCYARQYDQAIEQATATLKLEPDFPIALGWLAHAYRHKGMFEEAFRAHLAVAKPEERPGLEQAYRSAGYRGVLHLLGETHKRNGNHIRAAAAFAQAGDREQAITILMECYRDHCPGMGRLKTDPDYDPVRSDPRIQEILAAIGYAD